MNTPLWLRHALTNPQVSDICLNGAATVFIDQGQGLQPIEDRTPWSDEEMKSWVLEQISRAGRSWDAKHPFIDATLASGHRIHVAFPPLARQGILVSLRRLAHASEHSEKDDSIARWGNSEAFRLLACAVRNGDSVIISGATGSGKTTLASDLLASVPEIERIVALEDTPELRPHHPHFVTLISRPPNSDGFGEVTLTTLLRQALRMRPDRIVLGECRGREVLDLLQSLNTGHRGALATLHANSAREALKRLELLCLLSAGGTVPAGVLKELLALGVQWVTQVRRVGGRREISELWRIEGKEGDTILMRPVFRSHEDAHRIA